MTIFYIKMKIRAGGGSFRTAGCSALLFLFMGNTIWCSLISLIRVHTVKFSQNFLKCTWIYMYAAAVIFHDIKNIGRIELMGTSCANICWTSLCHLCLYLVTLRCLRWLPGPIILSPEIDMCLHMQLTVCGLVWSGTFMAFFLKSLIWSAIHGAC